MKNISTILILLIAATGISFAQIEGYSSRAVEKNDTVIISLATTDGNIDWQQSTDKINWNDIPGSSTQIKFVADQTTYFRVISTIEGCFPDTSDLVTISVFGEVIDIDGNTYKTVQIGEQVWMAENLRVTHYPDGESIFKAIADSSWAYTDSMAFCWYNNDSATFALRNGALYNWYAAMYGGLSSSEIPSNTQGICPDGWHLPSDGEWQTLEMELGMDDETVTEIGWRGESEGAMLSGAISQWDQGELLSDEQFGVSGFKGLPTGDRTWDDGSIFYGNGVFGTWWSATQGNGDNGWSRYIQFNRTQIRRDYTYKWNGISVRCVKN